MGFKRTSEGRVFFAGSKGFSNDDKMREANSKIPPLTDDKSDSGSASLRTPESQMQILSLLKSLNEKLQLSQIERSSMRQELQSYRDLVERLENKAEAAERKQQALQEKLSHDSASIQKAETTAAEALRELEEARKLFLKLEDRTEAADRQVSGLLEQADQYKKISLTMTKKQAELERSVKQQQAKIENESISYEHLVDRLTRSEQKQLAIENRFKNTIAQQQYIVDKIDEEIKSRARFMRKIETIEQTLLVTQSAMEQNKLASPATQGSGAYVPTYAQIEKQAQAEETFGKFGAKAIETFVKPISLKVPVLVVVSIALLLGGWALSMSQQPYMQQMVETVFSKVSLPDFTPTPVPIENWETSSDVQEFILPSPSQQRDMAVAMDSQAEEIASALNAIQPGQIDADEENEAATAQTATNEAVVTEANNEGSTNEVLDEAFFKAENIQDNNQAANTGTLGDIIPSDTIFVPQTPQIAQNISAKDTRLPLAMREIEAMAIQGNVQAQHDLAAIYVTGHAGVPQDYDRAAYWFDKAAQGGVVNASYNLGVLYHQGLGVERNIEAAMRWYSAAAEKGHPEAQYNLGIAHIEGIGVKYDPAVATLHFEKAAQNGVVEAAYNLGLIYENGLLGAPKPDEALMWYKTAADAGSVEAKSALKQLAGSLNISADEINSIVKAVKPNVADTPIKAPAEAPTVNQQPQKPASSPAPAAAPESSKIPAVSMGTLTMDVQGNLMRLGLYPGPADGRNGPLTMDAIRTYQMMNNLEKTGQVSAGLLKHMRDKTL